MSIKPTPIDYFFESTFFECIANTSILQKDVIIYNLVVQNDKIVEESNLFKMCNSFIQDFMQTSIFIGLKNIHLESFAEIIFFVLDTLLSAFVNLMSVLTVIWFLLITPKENLVDSK